jgi:hypothetical protein
MASSPDVRNEPGSALDVLAIAGKLGEEFAFLAAAFTDSLENFPDRHDPRVRKSCCRLFTFGSAV